MNDKDAKQLLKDVSDLKRLMILQLLGQGMRQKQIALMLGISEGTMSGMLPRGLTRSVGKKPPVDLGNEGSAPDG